jgi:ferredoxin
MSKPDAQNEQHVILEGDQLQALIAALQKRGFQVVGPNVRDGAIVYRELSSAADLPVGWTDEQEGGHYRLKQGGSPALFSYVVGPHSWKKFLYPPTLTLWQAKRENGSQQIVDGTPETPKYAFVGVRPCELQAIAIQDKVLLQGEFVDPVYKDRREKLFTVAVNCVVPGGTCFCTSMKTGPKATSGFDLCLTEVVEPGHHYFVVESGSSAGAEILGQVNHKKAGDEQQQKATELLSKAAKQMGRQLDTDGLQELLHKSDAHPRWDEVAKRCMTCGNCTMVCPTCFCVMVNDSTDLQGKSAERIRRWDSCFTIEFSYMHGGSVRTSNKGRYRQWMTHKLASWVDQFGTFGCVGCGRCITWCPVGIDITEEAAAIRGEGMSGKGKSSLKEKTHGNA